MTNTKHKNKKKEGQNTAPNGNDKQDNSSEGDQSRNHDGQQEQQRDWLFEYLKEKVPLVSRAEQQINAWLGEFRVHLGLRIIYILLSSYGSYAMIQESPTPIFRGWTAFFILVGYIANGLLPLVVSNRELKICWLFLRSFSTWRFFYAFYIVYPEHSLRLSAITGATALYAWLNNGEIDRKATTALAVSLFLVASDTPKLRKVIWSGENSRVIQAIIGATALALLGGWKVYRWFALVGLYIANDALLMSSYIPANQEERLQLWIIAASPPSLLVYNAASVGGLKSYFAILYTVILVFVARANSPSDDILSVRTTFTFVVGLLLEVFVFGLTGTFIFLAAGLVVYLVSASSGESEA